MDLLESLLNRDSPIDSTKIDSIFDEFSLPRPPEESNSEYSDATIESLSPSPIPVEDSDPFMEEIDIFLASDDSTPPGVESDYDSEGDILLLDDWPYHDLTLIEPTISEASRVRCCTDISKITRKPSKTGKHGHGKRKSTKEAKDSEAKPRKVNPQSTMGKENSNSRYAIKECSTCGSLYTRECCSIGSLENKILVPEPDSSPCCAKCGTPVDGPYCRGCALLRKKFEEDLLTYCGENETSKDFEDISESIR
ncbi:hypothetical protein Tco_0267021 [Tanacetum coccineum]